MWHSYLNGILVAFGLIMAIGAQNAFVLAQSLRREHHLAVAALCVFCDALLVTLGVFGLATLLAQTRCCWGLPAGAAPPSCSTTAPWPCTAPCARKASVRSKTAARVPAARCCSAPWP